VISILLKDSDSIIKVPFKAGYCGVESRELKI
jgi:hypothetical protein